MRCALILPAPIEGWGGVQRFGACIRPALTSLSPVWAYRLHPRPGGSRLGALVAGARDLHAGHRRHRFDVVITTFHWPPRLLPAPMVGMIHDLRRLNDRGMTSAAARLQRAILSTWDLVLVPTDHVRDDVLVLAPGRRVVVIGEGTDHLDQYVAAPVVRDQLVVLGGGASHKRAELALGVAEAVVARLGVRCVVLGLTPRPSGDGRICVLPSPSDEEVAAAHLAARVVVAPSRYEGFGLAVGEALRLGAPVVYATDGTLGSLVGAGGVAAPPTPSAMADAVAHAWEHTEGLSAEARRAVHDLTWEATAARILDEVATVVADGRRSGETRRSFFVPYGRR